MEKLEILWDILRLALYVSAVVVIVKVVAGEYDMWQATKNVLLFGLGWVAFLPLVLVSTGWLLGKKNQKK